MSGSKAFGGNMGGGLKIKIETDMGETDMEKVKILAMRCRGAILNILAVGWRVANIKILVVGWKGAKVKILAAEWRG